MDGWPAALDPLAIILGLVLSVPNNLTKGRELSEGCIRSYRPPGCKTKLSFLDARAYPRQARQMWMGLER